MKSHKGCYHFQRVKNDSFWDSGPRSYKCMKVCLKMVYYLIKRFFTRKLSIVVSTTAKCWIFSKQKYIIYVDVKKQGSKYGTLRDARCNFSSYNKTISDLIFACCLLGNSS